MMSLPKSREELRTRWNAGERFHFYLFYGHKQSTENVDDSCLSQWFEREFVVDGRSYATAEHWMMVQKAKLFGDLRMIDEILNAGSPKEAKALGRRVKDFKTEIWDQHKFEIVIEGNRHKFSQHADLKNLLLSTAYYRPSRGDNLWHSELEHDVDLDDALTNMGFIDQTELAVQEDLVDQDQQLVQERMSSYQVGSAAKRSLNVILVEAAGRDLIWGIGLGKENPKSQDPNTWRGRNLLGFALTQVREELMQSDFRS